MKGVGVDGISGPNSIARNSGVPRNVVLGGGGFQKIHLGTEERGKGDLGGVAP